MGEQGHALGADEGHLGAGVDQEGHAAGRAMLGVARVKRGEAEGVGNQVDVVVPASVAASRAQVFDARDAEAGLGGRG